MSRVVLADACHRVIGLSLFLRFLVDRKARCDRDHFDVAFTTFIPFFTSSVRLHDSERPAGPTRTPLIDSTALAYSRIILSLEYRSFDFQILYRIFFRDVVESLLLSFCVRPACMIRLVYKLNPGTQMSSSCLKARSSPILQLVVVLAILRVLSSSPRFRCS